MSNFLVGTNLADVQLDKFSGNASTVAFTLSVPSSTFSALVRISGVVQTPVDDFNISGTAITFTSAPPIGTDNIVVTYTKAAQVGVPNDASVSADKLASNAVTTAKILDANVTLAKMAAGTDGELITWDASGDPTTVAVGTATHVLTSNGAGATPTFQAAAAGGLVQRVHAHTGAVATGTTTLLHDDSVPQNTEGDEYMTLAITPTNASNVLFIEAQAVVSSTAGTTEMCMALFQDTTAGALSAVGQLQDLATYEKILTLRHKMAAGTTSATTFKIRIGCNTGTNTLNGQSGARRYGGVNNSYITITEISA